MAALLTTIYTMGNVILLRSSDTNRLSNLKLERINLSLCCSIGRMSFIDYPLEVKYRI
jgi:hypothetical protein